MTKEPGRRPGGRRAAAASSAGRPARHGPMLAALACEARCGAAAPRRGRRGHGRGRRFSMAEHRLIVTAILEKKK